MQFLRPTAADGKGVARSMRVVLKADWRAKTDHLKMMLAYRC